jgi:hypothetical protein
MCVHISRANWIWQRATFCFMTTSLTWLRIIHLILVHTCCFLKLFIEDHLMQWETGRLFTHLFFTGTSTSTVAPRALNYNTRWTAELSYIYHNPLIYSVVFFLLLIWSLLLSYHAYPGLIILLYYLLRLILTKPTRLALIHDYFPISLLQDLDVTSIRGTNPCTFVKKKKILYMNQVMWSYSGSVCIISETFV